MLKNIRKVENIHVALWLLKDTCWVMDFHLAGVIMIVPTIGLAVYITWQFRKVLSELYHNMAICCWITANSIWMIGEFFFDDTLRHYAAIFFFIGIALVLFFYLFVYPKTKNTPEEVKIVPVRKKEAADAEISPVK
ncbi:MAG: hypothetical protein INR69_17840 [Mucilaginibacter polytrichastri]|nr:hypothetical protein [Mucilaginibacter polytrichastri]